MSDTNKTNCAVMFADISGSSSLYSSLGNEQANKLINKALTLMTEISNSYYGEIIKTIGDEIMACFDNCDRAVKAAMELQRSCSTLSTETLLQLHIGLDYGEIIRRQNDLFGDTVNNAAYLTSIANRGKILVTENILQELSPASQSLCHEYDKVVLKGHNQKTSIYRLFWEETREAANAGVTHYVSNVDFTENASLQTLELHYQDKRISVTSADTPFPIGRNEGFSSLFIPSEFASRDHCQILYRHGRFILSDHSTNGTYVSQHSQPEIYLRREELPLLGEGLIGIGQPGKNAGENGIRFRLL